MPIAATRRGEMASNQLEINELTSDRSIETKLVNELRLDLANWRNQGYPNTTHTTKTLLEHWKNSDREPRIFFCQFEAIETSIYLTEAAEKSTRGRAFLGELDNGSSQYNPGLFRVAHKMATGTGKTVVMAMLICYHTLNKIANPQDKRFTKQFLICTPGITIRDRLRVLYPAEETNYFRKFDLVPPGYESSINQAEIIVTNFHAFLRREKLSISSVGKEILGEVSAFTEKPGEMVNRVCRNFGTVAKKSGILVINDEAHHCYMHKSSLVSKQTDTSNENTNQSDGSDEPKLSKEEKDDNKRAEVWVSGLKAIQEKLGINKIYDLSATPFFLRGSGYGEGRLFPWVVSDFSLIDAIEAGLVKIPRVPVDDNDVVNPDVAFRNLWKEIRDDLPKGTRSRNQQSSGVQPILPDTLEAAVQALYGDYEKRFKKWEQSQKDGEDNENDTPPVFIVVCNNTLVSKLVFDYIGGWEKSKGKFEAGQCTLFSNVKNGSWIAKPVTILVDSVQLDNESEKLSKDFETAAANEIEIFRQEYSRRFRNEKITNADILREVMNTVGKPGKLGEHIRCVVSVSMLTEGWDANTVTHILGVRAFGTQLLCEQVVGRGLRRQSYALDDENGHFTPEYAEIYGVPFSFIPTAGQSDPKPPKKPTRVRTLEERDSARIFFPLLRGYRYEIKDENLTADFDKDSELTLTIEGTPTVIVVNSAFGQEEEHNLEALKQKRMSELEFQLSKEILGDYFEDRQWLFPSLLKIVRMWAKKCLKTPGDAFPQMLWIGERKEEAKSRIYKSIVRTEAGDPRLTPVFKWENPEATTDSVSFDTAKDTRKTGPKSHISHTVADSRWEFAIERDLEKHPKVIRYVKNEGPRFTIPYRHKGVMRNYIPDFIADLDIGEDEPLHLIIEVTGKRDSAKAEKVSTARNLWVPAVNNSGEFGTWHFIEILDPYSTSEDLAEVLKRFSNTSTNKSKNTTPKVAAKMNMKTKASLKK